MFSAFSLLKERRIEQIPVSASNSKQIYFQFQMHPSVLEKSPLQSGASDGKKQGSSWNLRTHMMLPVTFIALHVFAVCIVVPLYRDGLLRPSSQQCAAGRSSFEAEIVAEEKMFVSPEQISVSVTSGSRKSSLDSIVYLDHGDPTMYEKFWLENGDAAALEIPGWKAMSYFSDVRNLCWFLEPELAAEIRRLHRVVGNAIAGDGRFIIVGTGSSQLYLAALFALSTAPDEAVTAADQPVPVVSSVPYYSSYPAATDLLKSGHFRWAGDASSFDARGKRYIEVVCSPNNPDGFVKTATVRGAGNGKLIHDLAYYWPQYTAITTPAESDIMLFTVSKCTGHAGTRLGWALVKDQDVARRMMKFIEVSTIGVSKDSQLRAAKILKAVSDGYEVEGAGDAAKLFHFSRSVMNERWGRLRGAVSAAGVFSLPEFKQAHCNFMGEKTFPLPAFAWLKCEGDVEDCESFLRQNHRIITRNGNHFGVDSKYARVSMLDRDETFDMFIQRLMSIHPS